MGVLPIRLLHLKQTQPDTWQKIDLLMDHRETMKDDEKSAWKSAVIDPILQSGLRPAWSEDDIVRAIGIINTNGVNLWGIKGCGLFPTFSFISHKYANNAQEIWCLPLIYLDFSCIANTRFQIHHDDQWYIKLTALTDIKKGQEITISYLPCNIGNTLRRSKIKKNWYFDCQCERCCDPTEKGTHFEAIRCQKCSNGLMLPLKALDLDSDWICDK